jgi:C1A family cysteine protease
LIVAVFAFMAGGCGGGGGNGNSGGYVPPPSGGGTLTVTPPTLFLTVGQYGTLTAYNVRGALTWRSENQSVATVGYGNSSTNTVTAVGPGTTTITVTDSYTQNTAVCIVTVTSGGTTPTPDPDPEPAPELVEAPPNPEFIEWEERIQRGEPVNLGYGVTPEPMDWSYLGTAKYTTSNMKVMDVLPPSYDARDDNAVTSIKNQANNFTCWAHGTLASLESTVLKKGTMTDPDFSERHLAWFTYQHANNSDDQHVAFTNVQGYDYPGGSFGRATAVLSRWTGPVNEAECPYSTSSPNLPPEKSASSYTKVLDVTDVYRLYISPLSNESDKLASRSETYAAMKELIMNEGALGVSYYQCEKSSYNNEVNAAYYYPYYPMLEEDQDPQDGGGHIVAIAGWDDNYSKINFTTQPPGDGAWLIKNSWGTDSGKGGYYWISYYDTTLGNVCLYKGEKAGGYKTMHLYDPLGDITGASYYLGKTSMYAANVFIASENEQIEAVAFDTTYPLIDYEVNIYKNPAANNPVDGELQVAATAKGRHTYAGYHTVRLTAPAQISAGESFSIVIKITNNDSGKIFFPHEYVYRKYADAATASPGQSFYTFVSEPNASTSWLDLYKTDTQPNFCIRALANPISSSPATAPTINTPSLPGGAVGTSYNQTLEASGTTPITWAIESGILPSGLILNFETGVISGTPTSANTFNFTVKATNSAGSATKPLSIVIYNNIDGNWIDVADTSWYNSSQTQFIISTAEQLAGLAKIVRSRPEEYLSGKTITLAGNISLAGREWTSIGNDTSIFSFQGTFDGGGHTITNLTFASLFEYNKGNIKNIHLTALNVSSAGSLARTNEGMITGCTASGNVFSSSTLAGGLVGSNRGTITGCTASVDVSSSSSPPSSSYTSFAGGLVGWNNGTIEGCTASGNASSFCSFSSPASGVTSISAAGGLVGTNSNGTITGCTASGKDISAIAIKTEDPAATAWRGGFIGWNVSGIHGTISNNHNETGITPAIGWDDKKSFPGPSDEI